MSTTDDQCVDLGSSMWLSVADIFDLAVETDGITDIADRVLVFAGFINTMSGTMLAQLGPEAARAILEQARDNCTKCARAKFMVVPK